MSAITPSSLFRVARCFCYSRDVVAPSKLAIPPKFVSLLNPPHEVSSPLQLDVDTLAR